MPERIRIFVDFWNFVLEWNDRVPEKKHDWPKLPQVLIQEAEKITNIDNLQYDGTRVYASVDMTTPEGGKLKNWLKSFLVRQPGINVHIRERKPRLKPVHCKNCNRNIVNCPECGEPFKRSVEKGVDSAIITDMFSLAWADAYSIAILVSSDADYVPMVENLQAKGFKVINATWGNMGYELRGTCWAYIDIGKITSDLFRN